MATSRDFTPISSIVEANLLAALVDLPKKNYIFNVGTSSRISLNELITQIYDIFKIPKNKRKIIYKDFRKGDIRHSLDDINNIKTKLGFLQKHSFKTSLISTINWFSKK